MRGSLELRQQQLSSKRELSVPDPTLQRLMEGNSHPETCDERPGSRPRESPVATLLGRREGGRGRSLSAGRRSAGTARRHRRCLEGRARGRERRRARPRGDRRRTPRRPGRHARPPPRGSTPSGATARSIRADVLPRRCLPPRSRPRRPRRVAWVPVEARPSYGDKHRRVPREKRGLVAVERASCRRETAATTRREDDRDAGAGTPSWWVAAGGMDHDTRGDL